MLTDKELKQIDNKEFRGKAGITKADYRFVRNLILNGDHLENITLFSQSDKSLTLHQFIGKLRGIDVIYITRTQKERIAT